MPIKTINGEPFNIVVEGKAAGPVLLFSNSLSSNLSMWDAQAEALKDTYRIIRYDSRGHGKSTAPEGPYSIAELGRDALAILDSLRIGKAHFCGLSKGGMVGQWLLTHHRDRIGKAVLANTSAQMPPPDLWNGRIRNVTQNGMAAIVDATIERWFTKGFIERAPQEIAAVRKMIAATPAAGYCGCAAAIRDMDQRESIRAIANPVLLISGAYDPATTPAMMELMRERIKGAQWLSLDAAHISNIEQAAAFTKAIREFLA
ncbi:MAG: 3-oxoadipate enol-lactonase [Methylocystis sp.]|nr:3-oxoadipate enol-lactonase [Methylocystis sp.]MCA3584279.1 3-oxoadipate enol-lactonase [Methylocystis sp.]MCA3588311.1 3-oxoadipate enol-lactonase [Methylocystis sp.]MCA3590936.1 3-oxoadipate enol-lactonase [Methylocystis sp.]